MAKKHEGTKEIYPIKSDALKCGHIDAIYRINFL